MIVCPQILDSRWLVQNYQRCLFVQWSIVLVADSVFSFAQQLAALAWRFVGAWNAGWVNDSNACHQRLFHIIDENWSSSKVCKRMRKMSLSLTSFSFSKKKGCVDKFDSSAHVCLSRLVLFGKHHNACECRLCKIVERRRLSSFDLECSASNCRSHLFAVQPIGSGNVCGPGCCHCHSATELFDCKSTLRVPEASAGVQRRANEQIGRIVCWNPLDQSM
jgi:hypothetical protein